MKEEYTTIKIKVHDHKVMKDAKRFKGVPISRQVTELLKKEYPNMYKEKEG